MDSEVPGDRRRGVANVYWAGMTWKSAIPDAGTVVRGTDNGGANIVRFLFNPLRPRSLYPIRERVTDKTRAHT